MRLVEIGGLVLGLVLFCAPVAALAQDAPPPIVPETAHAAGAELQQQAPEAVDAALGTVITYQGALTNGGQPANGAYDFRFRLFDAASNGTQVGADVTLNDATVTAGIFTAQLGFGDVFNNTQLYLEIAVRPGADGGAYTVLAPRQRLTAAPYANYARKAPWSGLLGVPAGFADNVDNDTQYGAGNGLVLANGVFAVNTGVIQQRVSGACAAGSSIRTINQDGTVVCEIDDTASGGAWSLAGNASTNPATQFLGTTDNVAMELRVDNRRALRIEPTYTAPNSPASPNIIGGYPANSAAAGIVGAVVAGGGSNGYVNQVLASYGTVGGGLKNRAGDVAAATSAATVAGGFDNLASGSSSTVSGGRSNLAAKDYDAVGGGLSNQATGSYATVGGGQNNQATGANATIAGGYLATATSSYATVGGGSGNDATGNSSTIAGGYSNAASAWGATVSGGSGNVASADYAATGGGGDNRATGAYAFVGGGSGNRAMADSSSVLGGRDASARLYGQTAYASGSFANPGDAQASVYVLRNRTINASTTELFLDGASRRLTVEPGRAMTFDVMIVARREGANQIASYHFDGVISNFSGVMVLSKTGGVILELDPTWNANLVTNNTDDALQIVVNGPTSGAVRWVATVETAEVAAP